MSLRDDIIQDIQDHKDWADKQAVCYRLRNCLIGRAAPPYPNAPDQRYPLIDGTIDKTKPFYVQQIYAQETLVTFIARTPDKVESSSAVGAWFDYSVKQKSNFERESISGIDVLLEGGGCPMKVRWVPERNRLGFTACDPVHVIVPKGTEELRDADRLTHVLHLTEFQYRSNKLYRQDDDLIKRIKGRGTNTSNDSSGKQADVERREGITHGQDDNQIVLWEIFTRDPSNRDRIIIKTRSPLEFDEEIRPDFQLPYSEGVFKEGWFPFVKWRPEITRKGHTAPRGLAEKQAAFQTGMNKTWNSVNEHLDFSGKPMFEQTEEGGGNLSNFKSAPGAIVPRGLRQFKMDGPPHSLREEMNFLRQAAELHVQAPDYGVMAEQGGKRTATEISAISGQTGQGSDMRARVFRMDLGDTYRMAWALLLQYGKESLSYVLHKQPQTLDATALDDCYDLEPNGSADSWNKGAQMAKAIARWQTHRGNPYVKQGELTKSVLELDDPGLVARLYQEPQDMQAGEMEEQAMEILIMEKGFPAAVDPTDDDKAHLMSMGGFVERRMQTGEPILPELARLLLQHGAAHDQAMEQKKDPAQKQFRQQMAPMIQMLSQIAAQPDPREAQNVVPMQEPAPAEAMV